jgi:hypothetical protein
MVVVWAVVPGASTAGLTERDESYAVVTISGVLAGEFRSATLMKLLHVGEGEDGTGAVAVHVIGNGELRSLVTAGHGDEEGGCCKPGN